MAFTYNFTTDTTYISAIRLHINDTTDGTGGQAKLTDAEILYGISEGGGTLGGGVCKCIQFLMAKVADPNFKADWLEVDNAVAYKSFKDLLTIKRQEFGISANRATTGYAWRPDSALTEAPTFDSTEDD